MNVQTKHCKFQSDVNRGPETAASYVTDKLIN